MTICDGGTNQANGDDNQPTNSEIPANYGSFYAQLGAELLFFFFFLFLCTSVLTGVILFMFWGTKYYTKTITGDLLCSPGESIGKY